MQYFGIKTRYGKRCGKAKIIPGKPVDSKYFILYNNIRSPKMGSN